MASLRLVKGDVRRFIKELAQQAQEFECSRNSPPPKRDQPVLEALRVSSKEAGQGCGEWRVKTMGGSSNMGSETMASSEARA